MTIFTENRRPPDRVRTNSARCPVRTLFDAVPERLRPVKRRTGLLLCPACIIFVSP